MGVARHFMPTLGNPEAIMLGSGQLDSFPIIVERLFAIKMEALPSLSALLIRDGLHFHSGRCPFLRGRVAEYQVAMMQQ